MVSYAIHSSTQKVDVGSVSLWTACSTDQVPGQSRLPKEPCLEKQKQEAKGCLEERYITQAPENKDQFSRINQHV